MVRRRSVRPLSMVVPRWVWDFVPADWPAVDEVSSWRLWRVAAADWLAAQKLHKRDFDLWLALIHMHRHGSVAFPSIPRPPFGDAGPPATNLPDNQPPEVREARRRDALALDLESL